MSDNFVSGYPHTTSNSGAEVSMGFVAAFNDYRQDKYGHFTLPDCNKTYLEIFRRIIEIEPSICRAGYILVNIRQPLQDIGFESIEYHKEEIQALLTMLRKPGIISRT